MKDSKLRAYKYTSIALLALFVITLVGDVQVPRAQASGLTLYMVSVTSQPVTSMAELGPNALAAEGKLPFQLTWMPAMFYIPANDSMIPNWVTNYTVFQNNNTIIVHFRKSGWSNGMPMTAWDFYASFLILAAVGSPPYNVTVLNNYTAMIVVPVLPKGGLRGLSVSSIIFGPNDGDIPMLEDYAQYKPLVQFIASHYLALQEGNFTVIRQLVNAVHSYNVSQILYSGAYYPTEVTSTEIVLSKNPYYYDADKLPIDKVVVFQVSSGSVAIQYLISGKLSFYEGLVPSTYAPSIPSYMKPLSLPGNSGPALFFNFLSPVVSNIHVRKAIAYAINRSEVALAGGFGESPLQWPIGMPPYMIPTICNTTCLSWMDPYNYNLTAATQEMEKAGYTLKGGVWTSANGTPATLTIIDTNAGSPQWTAMALDIESQLKAFHFNVNLLIPSNLQPYTASGTGYDIWMAGFGFFITPWDIYNYVGEYFNGDPLPIIHFNQTVYIPINGIGNTTAFELMATDRTGTHNVSEEIRYTQALAWMVDHYLPELPLVSEARVVYVNTAQFSWPPLNNSLWTNDLELGFPLTVLLFEQEGLIGPATQTSTTTSTTTPVTSVTTTTSVSTTTVTSSSVTTSVTTSVSTTTSVVPSVTTSVVQALPVGLIAAIVVIVAVVVAVVMYLILRRR